MKFKERSKLVMDKWCAIPGHPKNRSLSLLEELYAEELEKAVADERESCAKVAESFIGDYNTLALAKTAEAIRARK